MWILLPPAGNDLRMFAIFLYVWFVAMVMMVGGDRPVRAGVPCPDRLAGGVRADARPALCRAPGPFPRNGRRRDRRHPRSDLARGGRGLGSAGADRARSGVARTRACHRARRTRRQDALHRRGVTRPATADPGSASLHGPGAGERRSGLARPQRAWGEERVPVGPGTARDDARSSAA